MDNTVKHDGIEYAYIKKEDKIITFDTDGMFLAAYSNNKFMGFFPKELYKKIKEQK